MKTLGAILWFPGGLGILLWMSVEEGNYWLILPALPLTPFALANLLVLYSIDLVKKILKR